VVLVARRKERLEEQAASYRQSYSVEAEVLPADLSTDDGISLVEKRISEKGDIDFLVNNAGYDEFGLFATISVEKLLGLINCLALASLRLSRAVLPEMLRRRRGAIVNVSSIGAFVPKPGDAVYVSSKAFINIFSESLAIELDRTGVRVQTLCPGFTLSEFHDAPQYEQYHIKERIPHWLWMTPEAVVEASLRALGEDRRVCVPGRQNQLITLAARTGLSQFLLGAMRSFLLPAFQRKTTSSKPWVDH
jgi:short-subunit dehydrogenase